MAHAMEIRLLIILFFLFSCSFDNGQDKISNISKITDLYMKKNDYDLKIFSRDEIKNIPYPLIEIRTNGILKQALMLPLSERNGFSNYTSGDGQNLTKNGAIISKTYGMNVGMISHRIQSRSPFLYLTKPNEWNDESFHEYEFISPSHGSKKVIVKCKIIKEKEGTIDILKIKYKTSQFSEKCSSDKYKFINYYWVDNDGFVWKSIQWIGMDMSSKKNIYAQLYVLKKNGNN